MDTHGYKVSICVKNTTKKLVKRGVTNGSRDMDVVVKLWFRLPHPENYFSAFSLWKK